MSSLSPRVKGIGWQVVKTAEIVFAIVHSVMTRPVIAAGKMNVGTLAHESKSDILDRLTAIPHNICTGIAT